MNNSELKVQNKSGSLFWYFIFLIIGLLLVLLLVFLIQYLKAPCDKAGKMNFLDYLLGLDVVASPCNPCDEPEVVQETCPEGVCDMEVVHVPDQRYTFPEAKYKCELSGGTLATKQQLIDAYNKGASWSNYGWSTKSNAYYPIQPCDFIKLRKKGIKIGPPGVNGGKFLPKLKFGINCYMKKPEGVIKEEKKCREKYPTACERNPLACKPIDNVSPFNPTQWSQCAK